MFTKVAERIVKFKILTFWLLGLTCINQFQRQLIFNVTVNNYKLSLCFITLKITMPEKLQNSKSVALQQRSRDVTRIMVSTININYTCNDPQKPSRPQFSFIILISLSTYKVKRKPEICPYLQICIHLLYLNIIQTSN